LLQGAAGKVAASQNDVRFAELIVGGGFFEEGGEGFFVLGFGGGLLLGVGQNFLRWRSADAVARVLLDRFDDGEGALF